jgi:hypothetical protein
MRVSGGDKSGLLHFAFSSRLHAFVFGVYAHLLAARAGSMLIYGRSLATSTTPRDNDVQIKNLRSR